MACTDRIDERLIRCWNVLIGICACLLTKAQDEHPFLSRFVLQEGSGSVTVEWTMTAGGTCDGTHILRSTDSIHFAPVGMISGICGDISKPTDLRFVDGSVPELATLFYRLQLGLNGYSSIKRIDLVRPFSTAHRFVPSPAQDHGELLLDLDTDEKVTITIHNSRGAVMQRMEGRGGRHPIDVSAWPAGLYLYEARSPEAVHRGRFAVE